MVNQSFSFFNLYQVYYLKPQDNLRKKHPLKREWWTNVKTKSLWSPSILGLQNQQDHQDSWVSPSMPTNSWIEKTLVEHHHWCQKLYYKSLPSIITMVEHHCNVITNNCWIPPSMSMIYVKLYSRYHLLVLLFFKFCVCVILQYHRTRIIINQLSK